MEIKDENIHKLMGYFDKCRYEIEKALDSVYESYKQGYTTQETLNTVTGDALRLTTEHQKIRNILFGTES